LTMSKLEEKYPSESWVRLYRWISHKCYNERRGWYIHSVSQWRAAIRGNTNRPTLFQLQSWRGSHHSCCTYHQVQSWQQHSSCIPDWQCCKLWWMTTYLSLNRHQNP
jgi:hypothetical protein